MNRRDALLTIGVRTDELPRVRDTRRSRATYLEQWSARVLRAVGRTLGEQPEAITQLSAFVGELLIEVHRAEEACNSLRAELATLHARRADLLDTLPVPCLLTDGTGVVVEVNREALRALNSSERHTVGKPVVFWFKAREDASAFVRSATAAMTPVHRQMLLTPREQRARLVSVAVQRAAGTEPPLWRWFFLDCEPESA